MEDFHAGPGDKGSGCGCPVLIFVVLTPTICLI